MAARGTTVDPQQLLAIVRDLARESRGAQVSYLTPHTSLERDLGLDSLARTELFLRASKAFDAEIPPELVPAIDTVDDLLRALERGVAQGAAPLREMPVAPQALDLPHAAQTLVDVLEWHAARQPERTHVLLHDERHRETPITHRNLLERAQRIARGLLARGLPPRRAVALMLPTGRDYLDTFFGVMLAGGIPVPIYPPARLSQLEEHLRRHARILDNAQAVLIVTVEQARGVAVRLQAAVPELADIVTAAELRAAAASDTGGGGDADALPALGPDDTAFLQYTSGSTGDPKGVVLTHANLLANVRALGKAAAVRPDDRFVSWLPLYHDMGLIGAWFGSLYHGIPLVLASPQAFLARPTLWLELISRHRGSISAAPNFAYALCVRHISDAALARLDLSSWRLALNGAEPVSVDTLEGFAGRFARCGLHRSAITPVYGLAECSVGLAFPPPQRGPRIDAVRRAPFERDGRADPAVPGDPDALRLPACGRALAGHEIRVVDEAGIELPERRIGRLEFRGPSATSGYFRNPAATAALLRGGWLDSGDYAYLAEGEVFITGRVKDLIKRAGRALYPYDLEEAVGNLPGVRKGCVAAFSSPDRATGSERLVLLVETREKNEAARSALQQRVQRTVIEVIGAPAEEVVLVPPHAVLKTSSGKIRRQACRERYERGELEQAARPAWISALAYSAGKMQARMRVGVRRAGAALFGCYAWLVLAALALPGIILLAASRSTETARAAARRVARALFALTGVALRVHHLERLPPHPHVLLVNHASYLDAIALTAALPAPPGYAYAAKAEFAGQFFMRTLLRRLGAVFVERQDTAHGAREVEAMAALLARGESLLVFPEGTLSHSPGIHTFHVGALLAAGRAGVPVVVAGLRGTRTALRSGSWWPHRDTLELEIGPILHPEGNDWKAATLLAARARAAMAPLAGEYLVP